MLCPCCRSAISRCMIPIARVSACGRWEQLNQKPTCCCGNTSRRLAPQFRTEPCECSHGCSLVRARVRAEGLAARCVGRRTDGYALFAVEASCRSSGWRRQSTAGLPPGMGSARMRRAGGRNEPIFHYFSDETTECGRPKEVRSMAASRKANTFTSTNHSRCRSRPVSSTVPFIAHTPSPRGALPLS